MENLNKNQFILLVLLVTFVTSIATGIMTFSLLQQAPVEVTRTINQVVEKTIDEVSPATTGILSTTSTQPEKVTTTVVVNEDDQVISAINKNLQSVVRIEESDPSSGTTNFFGVGVVVTKDGQIVTARQTVTAGNTYAAVMPDNTTIELNPVGVDKSTSFLLFVPLQATTTVQFTPAVFASADPQLGQTVVMLGGDTTNAVGVGRVISLDTKVVTVASTTAKIISSIETDVPTKDLVSGSPLFNLSGDIVGFEMAGDASKIFTSVNIMKRELPILVQSIP
jgi:S1-C subfamily serine protease